MARVWEIFCRVIDNLGDIGVCWRVANDLAHRGEQVRLWTDDASALRWMAPQGRPSVRVLPWLESPTAVDCGDIVIEAFGCNPPHAYVACMKARAIAPVWINLEYLTAQAYARQNHGLRSPQLSGPGAGLTKWFFHPGFVPGTGGLMRERDLESRQRHFDAPAWRAAHGFDLRPGERSVSLFCYANTALASLLNVLGTQPTLVLAAPGAATDQLRQLLGPTLRRGALRAIALPWLSQPDYDHLLWSCDLNFVRGEDSWVRAQWTDRPFIWQPYVQSDDAHHAKLHAFLDLYLANAAPEMARDIRALWARWNGLPSAEPGVAPMALPDPVRWQDHQRCWSAALREQTDLTTQLLRFVSDRR